MKNPILAVRVFNLEIRIDPFAPLVVGTRNVDGVLYAFQIWPVIFMWWTRF